MPVSFGLLKNGLFRKNNTEDLNLKCDKMKNREITVVKMKCIFSQLQVIGPE